MPLALLLFFAFRGRPLQVQPNIFCHGFRDIYTGVSGALLGTVPTAFVYFWAYENSSKYLKDKMPEEWCVVSTQTSYIHI
jgi:hypothetical protein